MGLFNKQKETLLTRIKKSKVEGIRHTITLKDKEGAINGRISAFGDDFVELSDGRIFVLFPLASIETISCHFEDSFAHDRRPDYPPIAQQEPRKGISIEEYGRPR